MKIHYLLFFSVFALLEVKKTIAELFTNLQKFATFTKLQIQMGVSSQLLVIAKLFGLKNKKTVVHFILAR